MVHVQTSEGHNRPSRFIVVALIGFQGRGFTAGVQPDFCHLPLLEALLTMALKMSYNTLTILEHKTPGIQEERR
jgi:hypothetical protein